MLLGHRNLTLGQGGRSNSHYPMALGSGRLPIKHGTKAMEQDILEAYIEDTYIYPDGSVLRLGHTIFVNMSVDRNKVTLDNPDRFTPRADVNAHINVTPE